MQILRRSSALRWWPPVCVLLCCFATDTANALESTWLYAVQISAVVQTFPPRITLSWPPAPSFSPDSATAYAVSRKGRDDTVWGAATMLSGSATNYIDTNVQVGATYEYQVIKQTVLGYIGTGYIYAGIQAPLTDDRGKLILIVANNHAAALSNELARLQSDLAGDGWQVIRHDVATNDAPSAVRNLIIADYNADPTYVKAVFLFGRVPILQSGPNLNYDGHQSRAMPADAYYGNMNGNWNGLPEFLPSDVELMVGRVDLFAMPGFGAPVPWPSELELLRNYLNKDHNWRHKLIPVQRRALMGDRRGAEGGEATASTGFRNFEPLVGPGNTILADTEENALPQNRWMSKLGASDYLWAYGCGGGDHTAISFLGTNSPIFSPYYWAYSTDVVGQDAKAVFVMVFGSWFGNWDDTDDFMRSFLATPTMGLAACMAGRPHWFVHHMGLGETIGYGTRLSMNNSTLYRSQTNELTRAIYISLMGDPTLRMEPVAPPGGLVATRNGTSVNLSWTASIDANQGYHVYRAPLSFGPFERLTGSTVLTTSFTDTDAGSGPLTYMVRAVKLEVNPSGSYFNASQGIFATIVAPVILTGENLTNNFVLSWNAQAGQNYRVLAKDDLDRALWTNLSGTLTANGTNLSWTDTNILVRARRFYQVASP
jgi:hypothetical protein